MQRLIILPPLSNCPNSVTPARLTRPGTRA